MIVVYGGSQADEADRANPRMPLDRANALRLRIRGLLQSLQPACVVGALASGADMIFAQAALAEQIPVKVVLPFDRDRFRETSVAVRGEPWTSHYDRILQNDAVAVREFDLDPADERTYHLHNQHLLDAADALAAAEAQRVWLFTLRPATADDELSVTDDLVLRAEERGMLTVDLDPIQSSGTAFIVMPYGRKRDPRLGRYVDCDAAFHKVYRVLMEDLDTAWTRADLETDSGIIHSGMLAELANSDIVLVDLSTLNFNVAYELGVRHVFAPRSTVLVDPAIESFKPKPPPFDVNMIRTHSFVRRTDSVSDEQAERAIRALRPVLQEALTSDHTDSPAHAWFDLEDVVRPFRQRFSGPHHGRLEADLRQQMTDALRRPDQEAFELLATRIGAAKGLPPSTVRGLRIELASALLDEGAYGRARDLLESAEPDGRDPLYRVWLQKSVMAYRRLGETASDVGTRSEMWRSAEAFLIEAERRGYVDSETHGIWGGLLKRQLHTQRSTLTAGQKSRLFSEIERQYRLGFQLDPDYYTGVNLAMAIRLSDRPRDAHFSADFSEVVTVTNFLTRVALTNDPSDFWALATRAELVLHESLESGTDFDEALYRYSEAARYGRGDQIRSARFQLQFLADCGDPKDVIDRLLTALTP